jgi:hypothetical protein
LNAVTNAANSNGPNAVSAAVAANNAGGNIPNISAQIATSLNSAITQGVTAVVNASNAGRPTAVNGAIAGVTAGSAPTISNQIVTTLNNGITQGMNAVTNAASNSSSGALAGAITGNAAATVRPSAAQTFVNNVNSAIGNGINSLNSVVTQGLNAATSSVTVPSAAAGATTGAAAARNTTAATASVPTNSVARPQTPPSPPPVVMPRQPGVTDNYPQARPRPRPTGSATGGAIAGNTAGSNVGAIAGGALGGALGSITQPDITVDSNDTPLTGDIINAPQPVVPVSTAARNLGANVLAQANAQQAFAASRAFSGNSLQIARVAPIYAGYNINQVAPTSAIGYPGFSWANANMSAPPGQNVLTIGMSLSTLHYSPSLAGGPLVDGLTAIDSRPELTSLMNLSGLNPYNTPWNTTPQPDNKRIASANFSRGNFIQRDPGGRLGLQIGRDVANLLDDQIQYLGTLVSNDLRGLETLLAQPFNVLLTWGAGGNDLDLHLTGPTGVGSTDRFHISYENRGSQTAFPFAELIKDCICRSGSEVILTSQLIKGGVYRISTFNFGDQSATSINLANAAGAQLQIVRGGEAVSVGNGTTINGGRVIYSGTPPTGQAGNTWVGVEINAANGRITAPNIITQSGNSDSVR